MIVPRLDPCPCGSGRLYPECCGPWHAGAPPPDAQSLMRSRYAAYVLSNERYLLDTWHPTTRPLAVPFNKNQKWLGLSVIDVATTGATSAEVEFVARSRVSNAAAVRQHERSRFALEGGRWFYLDGEVRERHPRK